MVLFNTAFMNGATLFGIFLTLLSLVFALGERLPKGKKLFLSIVAYLYLVASALAFIFPNLSS